MATGGQPADETEDGDFTHGPESLLGLVWVPVKELDQSLFLSTTGCSRPLTERGACAQSQQPSGYTAFWTTMDLPFGRMGKGLTLTLLSQP